MYTRIYQNLFEIFKAFKNIKIYKTQRKFSDLFSQLDRKITGIDIKSKTLFVLPKIYFEGVIIIAVLFLILFFIFFNFSENQVIIILSFYALCSYKIIPGISKIHHHTEQIKFLSKSFYNIFDEYVKEHVSEDELNSNFLIKTVDLEEQNLMKLNNICFSYVEDKTSNIFENLNLEIKKNKNIFQINHVKNISKYYQFADIFITSSYREGFGVSVAQAMACGLPVPFTCAQPVIPGFTLNLLI